jgi:hypothetical protein
MKTMRAALKLFPGCVLPWGSPPGRHDLARYRMSSQGGRAASSSESSAGGVVGSRSVILLRVISVTKDSVSAFPATA